MVVLDVRGLGFASEQSAPTARLAIPYVGMHVVSPSLSSH
jgi:hypothetical protein